MHTKLVQFTLLIPINKRLREFNFRQRSPELYDVNTPDERGERYYFRLEKETTGWRIGAQLLPAWIRDNESSIVDAFVESGHEG